MENQVKRVYQISSNISKGCPECTHMPNIHGDEIQEMVNHVLQHGYTLLHVGQQTYEASDGKIWQTTVAILGK